MTRPGNLDRFKNLLSEEPKADIYPQANESSYKCFEPFTDVKTSAFVREQPRIEVHMPEPSEVTMQLSDKGDDLDLAFSQLNSLLDKESARKPSIADVAHHAPYSVPAFERPEPTSLLPNYNMMYGNAPQAEAPPMPYK